MLRLQGSQFADCEPEYKVFNLSTSILNALSNHTLCPHFWG